MRENILSAPTVRLAEPRDREALIEVWRVCFGDDAREITQFFEHFGEKLVSVTAEIDGVPAGAGHLFPAGSLIIPPRRKVPCAMIYAVGTLPEYRGRGVGGSVTRALTERGGRAGYGAIALSPAEDGLFAFYEEKASFHTVFYAEDAREQGDFIPVPVVPAEYRALRERILRGALHIDFDERALAYQQLLCRASGGFLAALERDNETAGCAVTEAGRYKELLLIGENNKAPHAQARRFGMLNFDAGQRGYMGLAFD
jgi:ribosomal protein S18 acetylase RimI-like enzyme